MATKSEDDPHGIARIEKRPTNNLGTAKAIMWTIIVTVFVLLAMYIVQFKLGVGPEKVFVIKPSDNPRDWLKIEKSADKRFSFEIAATNRIIPRYILRLNDRHKGVTYYLPSTNEIRIPRDLTVTNIFITLEKNQGITEALGTYREWVP